MVNNKFVQNVFNMMISNIVLLFTSVFSSFVTPVILGHYGFGYYKIFTLYISYVPLLHLGFIDGILIRNAGRSKKSISLRKFRLYTRFLFSVEFIISVFIVISILFLKISYVEREIYISIAIYSFIFNMVTYFQFFSKCILKFKQLAFVTRLQSFINLFFIVFAYILYKIKYNIDVGYYLVYTNITLLIILIYYLFTYREIVFGVSNSLSKEKRNIVVFFKIGFAVMISYQIVLLMINSDNQFISIFFKISEYSSYAFAYSLGSILVTIFSALSSVMLPYMKKSGKEAVLKNYERNLFILIFLVFCTTLSYYPIRIVVNTFLQEYINSVQYLRIVFPGVAITCIIQSYVFNNFIILNRMKQFSIISFFNLLFDYFVYYCVYLLTHNTFAIALLSIPLLLIWYFSLEFYFSKIAKTSYLKNFAYIIILSVGFILINHSFDGLISVIMYVILLLISTFLIQKKLILSYFKKNSD